MRLHKLETDHKGIAPWLRRRGAANPLKIHDVPVLVSKGKARAALPSKPQIAKEGRHKTDVNGKAAYVPVLEWKNRELTDRFSAAVVELVQREHPAALDGGGGAP
jgi:hypothetical protein